jgi:hypothetical protein
MTCKIYPELLSNQVRDDPKLSAEVLIYDLLKSQLGPKWVVFYDVAWLGRPSPEAAVRDGQVDFVVGHPRHGVLLIEVKGGAIRFDGPGQQWYSRDRFGQEHGISPFSQVRSCKHALLRKLQEVPALRGHYIALAHCVCFPFSERPSKAVTPESPPEVIIGSQDLDSLAERVLAILNFSAAQDGRHISDGDRLIAGLTGLLARSVELKNTLAAAMAVEKAEMVRLTESQGRVLSQLQRVRRAAIGGPAGSGKTFLAIEKAKKLADQGFKSLLVCSSPALAEFLGRANGDVANLSVASLQTIATEETRRNLPGPDALMLDAEEGRVRFDAIVVDEGQDLDEPWWIALEACLPISDGVLYVFYDTHQAFGLSGGYLPAGLVPLALEDNVRNTREICGAVSKYYRGEVPLVSRGPAGRSIEELEYGTEEELLKSLERTIRSLISMGRLRPADIVVLTPREVSATCLRTFTLDPPLRLVHSAAGSISDVRWSTVEGFKGLEAKAVIVIELDRQMLESERRDANCYVAFSRPRHHLVLMGERVAFQQLRLGRRP